MSETTSLVVSDNGKYRSYEATEACIERGYMVLPLRDGDTVTYKLADGVKARHEAGYPYRVRLEQPEGT